MGGTGFGIPTNLVGVECLVADQKATSKVGNLLVSTLNTTVDSSSWGTSAAEHIST